MVGEAFLARSSRRIAASPTWLRTILIITYDEHGGYYDHVPPPVALAPDGDPAAWFSPDESTYDGFHRYGFRVPSIVVGPYSKRNHVSHVVYDHTSILAFLERKWNLPAMTYRDANANDLTDFLDLGALAAAGRPSPSCPRCRPRATPRGRSLLDDGPGNDPAPAGTGSSSAGETQATPRNASHTRRTSDVRSSKRHTCPAAAHALASRPTRGCGEIGIHAAFRSLLLSNGRGGSSPLSRITGIGLLEPALSPRRRAASARPLHRQRVPAPIDGGLALDPQHADRPGRAQAAPRRAPRSRPSGRRAPAGCGHGRTRSRRRRRRAAARARRPRGPAYLGRRLAARDNHPATATSGFRRLISGVVIPSYSP